MNTLRYADSVKEPGGAKRPSNSAKAAKPMDGISEGGPINPV